MSLAKRDGQSRAIEELFSPADISAGERTLVQPDLFVMPRGKGPMPGGWVEVASLLLAIEVLSPTTARADRHRKRRLYQRERVPEYWIVNVDAGLIERWHATDERPEIVTERLEWLPDPSHPPLVIDLASYFRDVIGESREPPPAYAGGDLRAFPNESRPPRLAIAP